MPGGERRPLLPRTVPGPLAQAAMPPNSDDTADTRRAARSPPAAPHRGPSHAPSARAGRRHSDHLYLYWHVWLPGLVRAALAEAVKVAFVIGEGGPPAPGSPARRVRELHATGGQLLVGFPYVIAGEHHRGQ